MATWRRWLRYAKAKVDATVRDAERRLDEKEARLEADQAAKPWLADDSATPSYEETKARIDRETGRVDADASPAGSGDPAFDLDAQQRAAAERLAEIRESLGLDDDADR